MTSAASHGAPSHGTTPKAIHPMGDALVFLDRMQKGTINSSTQKLEGESSCHNLMEVK
jgi:hypothetical protein